MTDFAECSMEMQDFLMILLEICLILELILLLIRITCFYGKKKIITAVTVFAVSFMLMGSLMNDHRYCHGESAYQPMLRGCPVSVLMAAMVVLVFYLFRAIWRERRRYHHSLRGVFFGSAWKDRFVQYQDAGAEQDNDRLLSAGL